MQGTDVAVIDSRQYECFVVAGRGTDISLGGNKNIAVQKNYTMFLRELKTID